MPLRPITSQEVPPVVQLCSCILPVELVGTARTRRDAQLENEATRETGEATYEPDNPVPLGESTEQQDRQAWVQKLVG